jgi:hypothetical protein
MVRQSKEISSSSFSVKMKKCMDGIKEDTDDKIDGSEGIKI